MLFYVDYSVEDATECEKKLKTLAILKSATMLIPKPILVSTRKRIRGDPLTYRTYLRSSDIDIPADKSSKRKRIEFRKL